MLRSIPGIALSVCILILGCTTRNSVNLSKPVEIPQRITFTGGSSESFHDAVIISGARDKTEGTAAEYKYISDKHGLRGNGWFLVGQTVIREKNKVVDVIEIQLKNSSDRRIFYFDVSDFIGKRK